MNRPIQRGEGSWWCSRGTSSSASQHPFALVGACEATREGSTLETSQRCDGRSGRGVGGSAPTSLDTVRGTSLNEPQTPQEPARRRACGWPCEAALWTLRNPSRVPWVRRARWRVCFVGGVDGARPCRARVTPRGVRCAKGRNRAASSRWASLPVRCETAGTEAMALERCASWSRHARRRARVVRRFPATIHRPKATGWRPYVAAVAHELEALGWGSLGARLSRCGARAAVRSCPSCGEHCAHALIPVGCDVRACPLCARRDAAESTREITAAALRVSGLARLAIPTKRAEFLERYRVAETRLADLSTAVAPRCLGPRRLARARARAEQQKRNARRDLLALRDLERGNWNWKLVTISPPRNPSDASEATPKVLRERVRALWKRWRAIWRIAGVSGLAASWVRVELSSTGHVHIHALYFGPYLPHQWLQHAAGCMVDVRGLRDVPGVDPAKALESMVREAAKYALKSASPAHRGWIAGGRHGVANPRLAAAWTVATRNVRLRESYGLAHEAAAAAEACDPDATSSSPRVCWRCGESLENVEPRSVPTRVLATLASVEAWRKAVNFERPRPCEG